MTINWTALLIVAVVSVTASVVFVGLLAGGIRLMSAGFIRSNQGQSAVAYRSGGMALLGVAGLLVLYGIYLIVPIFH